MAAGPPGCPGGAIGISDRVLSRPGAGGPPTEQGTEARAAEERETGRAGAEPGGRWPRSLETNQLVGRLGGRSPLAVC
jgi:hypothetical protein